MSNKLTDSPLETAQRLIEDGGEDTMAHEKTGTQSEGVILKGAK